MDDLIHEEEKTSHRLCMSIKHTTNPVANKLISWSIGCYKQADGSDVEWLAWGR